MNVQQQIEKLLKLKLDKYTKTGASNPEVRAGHAVADIINIYKNSPLEHLQQLLEWEIEDAIKANNN